MQLGRQEEKTMESFNDYLEITAFTRELDKLRSEYNDKMRSLTPFSIFEALSDQCNFFATKSELAASDRRLDEYKQTVDDSMASKQLVHELEASLHKWSYA
jgi:hypothetical protein